MEKINGRLSDRSGLCGADVFAVPADRELGTSNGETRLAFL